MTARRFDAILNLTDKLRLISTGDKYPIDILSIVIKLDGTIFIKKEKGDGVDQYSSMIKIIEPHKFEISILNPDASRYMANRFGIARCLGYLFLHTKYVDGGGPEVCRVAPSTILGPVDVDIFAASLLMPRDHFLEIANKSMMGSKYNIDVISDYFQVPAERVRNYGTWLGTYRWNKD